ncbi:glutaredoxin 3 [Sphingopyxis sp.]|uniref:glutaredoxin 3 n=1 Tax=Sphingopyxis sp. TaxID=1908224 RepID=UPI003BA911BA
MAKIEIYTKGFCGFCARAKALLDRKGAAFHEIDVTMDRAGFEAMVERANGGRTVPQIFIDGKHVGGSDDLAALEAKGELDALLKAA